MSAAFRCPAILLAILPALVTPALADPTREERLARLSERIEEARIAQNIAGLAVAVVEDDEIIFAQGFGLANVDAGTPATPETIFAVGSTTKAFTSAIIAMLVDEGKMSWDDPASKFLPAFSPAPRLADADDDGVITVRDLLSHRTGFTRMSMAWASGVATRDEVLAAASAAEPWAPFRQRFLYNNVMYMAAGVAAGIAAESDWETLVRERIFAPLGMDDATLTYDEANRDPRLATGYRWKDDAQQALPMRRLDTIGPAGSINAHALDMAEWVRFQLAAGVHDGERLVTEEALLETRTPQITVAGDISYGLGWMLHEWNGRSLVEHGGNIDGFAAQVAMLPDENIGFVLLMNTGYAPLQNGSIDLVFDTMLSVTQAGDAPPADDAEAEGLERFAGVYVADYPMFEDESFTVSVVDGELRVDIPSQRVYTVGPPGDNGRRPFVGVPGLSLDFTLDDAGHPIILNVYQGGLKFEMPRVGYEWPIDIPLEDLQKYIGAYHFEPRAEEFTVFIRNNHLTVSVPNQMDFELRPPDADGRWQFRTNDVVSIAVSFAEDEAGAIPLMTLHQGGQDFVLPRVVEAGLADAPTLADLVKLADLPARQRALESFSLYELVGTVRFAQAGVSGSASIVADGGSRFSTVLDLGSFGLLRTVVDGDRGCRDLSIAPFESLSGVTLDAARAEHPALFLGDWSTLFDAVRVTGRGTVEDRSVVTVAGTLGDLPPATLHVDAQTGDILQIDSVVVLPDLGGARLPITTTLSGWRVVNGLRVPAEITSETDHNGKVVLKILHVRTKTVPEAGRFAIEDQTP